MGRTMIEKIISQNTGRNVCAGDIVTVNADRVMIHDIFVPFVAEKFKEMGFKRIWGPERVVLVYDHMVPASRIDDTRHFAIGDEFAKEYGIKNVHRADGVCHQLMVEKGYAGPFNVIFGTDSHTTTYGGVGAFSTGIGYTEMAAVLGTGSLWVKVPETIKVTVNGKLPPNVMSKDIILTLLGQIKSDGATYMAIEFGGETVREMSVSSRLTIANMAVEAGAKCCLFEPDKKTAAICGMDYDANAALFESLRADADATYARTIEYDASNFVPVAACPSQVDRVRAASTLSDIKIDQVFIGSCTNGRLEDLMAAAGVLKGKKVAPFVKLIVTPASRGIYEAALENGTIAALLEAGAIITHPSCGLCCGRTGGILSDGETVISTNNRNFLGRMGAAGANIYLASPYTAAMSAVAGHIAV